MVLILLFLPSGILPTLSNWLEERRAPRAAHEKARSMAEMYDEKPTTNSESKVADEASSAIVTKQETL
jgi:hypothetical protein